LSDERLIVEGISGTSAGAVNAVMLADGLARGGRAEAQKRLADFWRAVSSTGNLPAVQRAVIERLLSFTPLEGSPVQAWLDGLSRYFSPYDANPLNINPLQDLIERFVDFEALRAFSDLQIFISATNVQTGRVRIFSREKITAAAVMASACLPLLFRAVEIDGVPYWDGGYLGNPVIFPFFRATTTEDVLVVQINPLMRQATPTSASEIMNRINEITFNSSLLAEYRRVNVHRIVLDRFGTNFDAFSKLSTDYDFFQGLQVSGKRAARRFLDEHFDDIGVRSTVDLRAEAQAEWA
jgi:NTE family protein